MAFAQAILSRSLPLQLKGVTLGPGATGRVVLNVCPEGHLLINKVVTGGLFGLNLKRCVRCNEQLKTVGAFWGIEPDRTLDATYQFWDDFISWSFGLASRSLCLEEWPGIGSPQLQAVRLSPLRVAPWHFPAEVDLLIETNSCQVLVVVDGSWSPKDFTHRVCGHSIHLVDPHAVNTNDTFHSDDTFLPSKAHRQPTVSLATSSVARASSSASVGKVPACRGTWRFGFSGYVMQGCKIWIDLSTYTVDPTIPTWLYICLFFSLHLLKHVYFCQICSFNILQC